MVTLSSSSVSRFSSLFPLFFLFFFFSFSFSFFFSFFFFSFFFTSETVSFGKGLIGVSVRDVVQYLQAYSSIIIQCIYRGYRRRWRYREARSKWMGKNGIIKGRCFTLWVKKSIYRKDIRHCCLRKLIAWRSFVRTAKKRRELFRACHWPFYIWRRYAGHQATAKQKAKFLVNRVVPTVLSMAVFRAWKVRVRVALPPYHSNLITLNLSP
jgi:hypothetical protein